MKVNFYCMFGVFGMLGLYFVVSSLFGRYSLGSAPVLVAKLCLVIGAAVGAGLLYWAYQVGEVEGRFGAGTGIVMLAVTSFQLVQVLGMMGSGLAKTFFHR